MFEPGQIIRLLGGMVKKQGRIPADVLSQMRGYRKDARERLKRRRPRKRGDGDGSKEQLMKWIDHQVGTDVRHLDAYELLADVASRVVYVNGVRAVNGRGQKAAA